jgi:hypothetical protein
MPDAIAYHDGFDLKTAEPLRVEVWRFAAVP